MPKKGSSAHYAGAFKRGGKIIAINIGKILENFYEINYLDFKDQPINGFKLENESVIYGFLAGE